MNIKKIRIRRGLRQEEMAQYLGITKGTYSKYENGELPINSDTLKKLAEYLNISTDYLLGYAEFPLSLSKVMLLSKLKEEDINFLLGSTHEIFKNEDSLDTKRDKMLELFNCMSLDELRSMIKIIRALEFHKNNT
jgi:transcriptional regulator with XRE-family HTH domain